MNEFFTLSTEELEIIYLTIRVALVSTISTLPVAVVLSKILASKQFPGKSFLESIITIPLVAPPVVTGYLLLLILGRNGILGKWLYETFDISLAFNFHALVIASVIVSLPLAVRTMKSAFELVDPHYEQASRTLGASRLATFTPSSSFNGETLFSLII